MRENPKIELFNKARKHAFSVLNKYNSFERAKFFLRDPRYMNLTPSAKKGLLAELFFFHKYKRKLKLTPALDCGDKTDFTGELEGNLSRFDVTTNLKYKARKDYEDYILDEWAFWLVNVDLNNEDFDFVPLHFPFCETCNKAPIYNMVYIKGELHSTYINNFQILKICPYCITYSEESIHNWGIELFLSQSEVRQYELDLIEDYRGKKELNYKLISSSRGLNNWIIEKGSNIARVAKYETNEPIAYIGEEPMIPELLRKDGGIYPIVLWNNLWVPSDFSRLSSIYIEKALNKLKY